MGPSPGPARARPGPVHFSRDRARNFEKGPSSTQARDRFLEKGLENLNFYVVKNTGSSRLGIELLWRAWARAWLEIDIQGSGLARDRFFRAQPITIWGFLKVEYILMFSLKRSRTKWLLSVMSSINARECSNKTIIRSQDHGRSWDSKWAKMEK